MSPAFGPLSLKNLEPTMNLYYRQFIKGIDQTVGKSGGIVEMNGWFHNLSFDVISQP